MSKSFTGVALLRAMEKELLCLDDPMHKYIPSFRHQKVVKPSSARRLRLNDADLEPPLRPVSLRHLVTHTSGLAYGLGRWDSTEELEPHNGETASYLQLCKDMDVGKFKSLGDLCDALAALPLRFQPGTQYLYSFGFDVAGRVVEIVSGKTLDRFMRDEIFLPTGMRHTGFYVEGTRAKQLSAMYVADMEERKGLRKQSLASYRGRSVKESRKALRQSSRTLMVKIRSVVVGLSDRRCSLAGAASPRCPQVASLSVLRTWPSSVTCSFAREPRASAAECSNRPL